jgi:hypothetical protein
MPDLTSNNSSSVRALAVHNSKCSGSIASWSSISDAPDDGGSSSEGMLPAARGIQLALVS